MYVSMNVSFQRFITLLQSRNDFVQLMLNAQAGEDIREEADEEEIKSVTKQNAPQGGRKGIFFILYKYVNNGQ